MRILVIEDDPTVGQFVKRGFEEQRWALISSRTETTGGTRHTEEDDVSSSTCGSPANPALRCCTIYGLVASTPGAHTDRTGRHRLQG